MKHAPHQSRGFVRVRRTAAAALAGAAIALCACSDNHGAPSTINVLTGSLPLYRTQGMSPRQDASGMAYIPKSHSILVVDDGGDPPDLMPAYQFDVENNFRMTEIAANATAAHLDLEAITYDGTYAYIISSLPPATEKGFENERFRNFSRFKFDNGMASETTTINPRDAILAALKGAFDPAWYQQIENLESKKGGTNIEGLTATPTPGELLIGLRSPHAGATFPGTPEAPGTRTGLAIVVKVNVTTFDPAGFGATVHTLDLGGLGVRGIQYSPTAQGYFISAGVVEQGWDYAFYFWKGIGSEPRRLTFDPFTKLCRPESLAEIDQGDKKYLMVLSEESGNICSDPPPKFSYFLVELNDAFLATLK